MTLSTVVTIAALVVSVIGAITGIAALVVSRKSALAAQRSADAATTDAEAVCLAAQIAACTSDAMPTRAELTSWPMAVEQCAEANGSSTGRLVNLPATRMS